MKRFKKILVATDTRLEDHPIVEEAAEIARNNGGSLKIVDVVPEFSWTVRLSLKDHEHMRELIGQEKQQKLEVLAARLRERGIDADTRVLYGKTSVEIIREVLRGEHDLVLRVAKGKDSRQQGFFGSTAVKLLRKCPCAVWLVAPNTTPKFSHVLGCVDTSTEEQLDADLNDSVYELASSISQYHQGRYSIIHAWSIWNEQMIKSRLNPEAFEEMEKNSHDQVAKLLDSFLGKHGSGIRAENVHLIKGDPPLVISDFALQSGVDLIVMGTVARSGLSGMIMGNTAEQILGRLVCSVLALKPFDFACPIRLEE